MSSIVLVSLFARGAGYAIKDLPAEFCSKLSRHLSGSGCMTVALFRFAHVGDWHIYFSGI